MGLWREPQFTVREHGVLDGEYGDPNSFASPGNGKPMCSGPLYYKNDT